MMKDKNKTKNQLMAELAELRQRTAELETSASPSQRIKRVMWESEKRLRSLFEMMTEGVVMIAPDGQIVQANHAAERILGLKLSKIEDRKLIALDWKILRPDGTPMPPEETPGHRAMKKRRRVENIVMGIERPDGSISWVNASAVPLIDKAGKLEGIVGTFADITEHKQAEKTLQRKTDQQEQLLQTARHLTACLDVTKVLRQIGIRAKKILKAHGCVIYLLETDGKTLAPVVAIDPTYEEEILSTPLNVESSFTGQAIKTRRGLIFNDPTAHSLGQQIPGTPVEKNERIIVAPFVADDKVLGAMCLNRMGTLFSEEDLALAETFATYAATALKNAQTHHDLQHEVEERKRAELALRESRRKIEGLHDTTCSLEACQSEDEVYQITAKAAEQILTFSLCTLDIVEGNRLVVKALSSGLPPETSVERDLDEAGLAGMTYRTGETFIFGDLDEVPGAKPTGEDFKSGISAPIGDIGVFQVVSTDPNAFSNEDKELLELLLGHTAEAVRRIRLRNELREQATRDPLTGAYNRRHFREMIERERARSKRYRHPIGFLMIDIDGFKQINDTNGHQTGDRVLQEVAEFLQSQVRAVEMVVRYGGDEFLIVMPERGREIAVVKQRIKKAVARWNEANEIFDFPVTLSIGGSYWSPRGSESLEEVLAKADGRMYEEKKGSKRAVEKKDLRTDKKDRKLKENRKTKVPI
ncbi:MAG: hypothetical protein AMJ92_11480 [candidate division Zixibacteria bacterium SM23_81]|nr:MAG: hypothetical protein AMJ92_11480 [candidate division Zixibacteria bacterium SM23_81]